MVNLPVKMHVSPSSDALCLCSWLPCVGTGGWGENQTGTFSVGDSAVILAGGLDPQSPLAL